MKWLYSFKRLRKNTVFSIDRKCFFIGVIFFSLTCFSAENTISFFSRAKTYWEKNETVPAVESLLLAAWYRKNPWGSFQDLSLLKQIQRSLINQPTPLEDYAFQIMFLFNENIKIIWICTLFWIFLGGLYLFWRLRNKKGGVAAIVLALVWLILGGSGFYLSDKKMDSLFVLQGQTGVIPVKNKLESSPDLKIQELPEGIIVEARMANETAVWIEKPVMGWIDRAYLRQVLLEPRR